MSGAGDKRNRAAALAAYKARQRGCTNRQIAEQLGRKVQKIPGLVTLGERLAQAKEPS
jgi:hypothetical protein